MALTLDATVGGINSNSYVTVARSNAIAETLPHMGEWLSSSNINKAQLLMHATRMIDLKFAPNGSKAVNTQALWWPQNHLYYVGTTTAISTSTIPSFVEYATVEWAWALHEEPEPYAEIGRGIKVLDTPSYRMEYTGNPMVRSVPHVVTELLSPYTTRSGSAFVRVYRT